jgi:hypothetical protein
MEDRVRPTIPWFNAAAIFSLAIGLLYIYGDTFRVGFLKEFALSRYLFMESFEQTLVTGFRLLLHTPKENFKSILAILFAFLGILGILWIAFRVVLHKKRTLLTLLSLVVMILTIALILGIFAIFYNYTLGAGQQYANQLKRQIDAELNLKGERGKLTKAIILYDGHENSRPKQLMGYIIAESPNGFAIYVEGKVNFVPMSRIIQISFPVK